MLLAGFRCGTCAGNPPPQSWWTRQKRASPAAITSTDTRPCAVLDVLLANRLPDVELLTASGVVSVRRWTRRGEAQKLLLAQPHCVSFPKEPQRIADCGIPNPDWDG